MASLSSPITKKKTTTQYLQDSSPITNKKNNTMSLSKKNQAYHNAKKDARKKELGLIKPGKQIQNAKKNSGMYV